MKINLIFENKKLNIIPFKLFFNPIENNIAIGVKPKNELQKQQISNDINQINTTLNFRNNVIYFESKDNVYLFDLEENFKKLPTSFFNLSLVFIDSFDKIIYDTYKVYDVDLSNYETNIKS